MSRIWMPRSFLTMFFGAGLFAVLSAAPSHADDTSVREKLRTIPLPVPGEQCAANAAVKEQVSAADVRATVLLSQIAANANAEQATATTDGILNGRGYNYGPDAGHFNFAVLQREAELKRQSESK